MPKKAFRILYVSHLHPPEDAPLENMGGMQRVSMQLLKEFEAMEDVEVMEVTQQAPWKGIEWYTARFLARLYWKLPKHIHQFKPDIILFSSMVTASLARMLRKRVHVPMVTINHGHDVTLPINPYQKFIPGVFDALSGVISVSRATRQACTERGMEPGKGIVLPNGFDTSNFEQLPNHQQAKQKVEEAFELNLSDFKLVITVGRKVKRKGHEPFIRHILPKVNTPVVYLTVGDGPESEAIKEAAQQYEGKHKILLAGRLPDELLQQIYAAADLFVMPNIKVAGDMEGFGVVMLEANSAGTPVVASALEGILDVISEGKNGWLIESGQHESFAEQIDLALSPAHSLNRQATHDFVMQEFAWNEVGKRYVEALKKVAGKL